MFSGPAHCGRCPLQTPAIRTHFTFNQHTLAIARVQHALGATASLVGLVSVADGLLTAFLQRRLGFLLRGTIRRLSQQRSPAHRHRGQQQAPPRPAQSPGTHLGSPPADQTGDVFPFAVDYTDSFRPRYCGGYRRSRPPRDGTADGRVGGWKLSPTMSETELWSGARTVEQTAVGQLPREPRQCWCCCSESNRGPHDYESSALPTELQQHVGADYRTTTEHCRMLRKVFPARIPLIACANVMDSNRRLFRGCGQIQGVATI